ncbi:MAG: GNAT family N-acetyltransferase [Streptosporangiales bacterium]
MTDVRALTEADWRRLRLIRLRALRDAPHAFISSYYHEAGHDADWWRERLSNDTWLLAFCAATSIQPIGVISATLGLIDSSPHPYVNSLWVARAHRRRHVARTLLHAVLAHLAEEGADAASLWILDGNEAALRLYLAAGFTPTGHRQLVPGSVNRHEERLTKHLRPDGR